MRPSSGMTTDRLFSPMIADEKQTESEISTNEDFLWQSTQRQQILLALLPITENAH